MFSRSLKVRENLTAIKLFMTTTLYVGFYPLTSFHVFYNRHLWSPIFIMFNNGDNSQMLFVHRQILVTQLVTPTFPGRVLRLWGFFGFFSLVCYNSTSPVSLPKFPVTAPHSFLLPCHSSFHVPDLF